MVRHAPPGLPAPTQGHVVDLASLRAECERGPSRPQRLQRATLATLDRTSVLESGTNLGWVVHSGHGGYIFGGARPGVVGACLRNRDRAVSKVVAVLGVLVLDVSTLLFVQCLEQHAMR